MSDIDVLEKAMAIAKLRRKENPDFEIYSSIIRQLEYLISISNGTEKDISRLSKVILGHFAVREFSETDSELAETLFAAQNIAFDMAKKLR